MTKEPYKKEKWVKPEVNKLKFNQTNGEYPPGGESTSAPGSAIGS